MSYTVRLRDEADHDLVEAAIWYEQQQAGLGHEFLDAVVSTFESIGAAPFSFPELHRNTRRAVVSRFPFAVFYQVKDLNIIVIALMHGSRHPSNWKKRI